MVKKLDATKIYEIAESGNTAKHIVTAAHPAGHPIFLEADRSV